MDQTWGPDETINHRELDNSETLTINGLTAACYSLCTHLSVLGLKTGCATYSPYPPEVFLHESVINTWPKAMSRQSDSHQKKGKDLLTERRKLGFNVRHSYCTGPRGLRAIEPSPDAKVVGKAVNEETSRCLDVQLYTVRHPIEFSWQSS